MISEGGLGSDNFSWRGATVVAAAGRARSVAFGQMEGLELRVIWTSNGSISAGREVAAVWLFSAIC